MRGARMWTSFYGEGPSDWDIKKRDLFKFRSHGYPERVPVNDETERSVILRAIIPNHRPGTYTIRWDGEGELAADLGARFTPTGSNDGEIEIRENSWLCRPYHAPCRRAQPDTQHHYLTSRY